MKKEIIKNNDNHEKNGYNNEQRNEKEI